MKKYYNQEKIASSLRDFFIKISSISKPLLKSISYIIIGMISAESVVTSDLSRKLKDDFSSILLESIERRFRRFFNSFSSLAYSFYDSFISYIVSKFSVKHSNTVHISFDHMFCKNKFTILLFSLRIGSIESIFKSQKSNGFRLESTNTQKIEHFISLFTIMCVALVWLTIIGVDYVKNKHTYHLKIRDTKKYSNGHILRLYSFFNLGLTIFNRCYYNFVDFTLKFNFVLYDI